MSGVKKKLGQEPAFARSEGNYDGGGCAKEQDGISKRFYAAEGMVRALIESPNFNELLGNLPAGIWISKVVEKGYKLADELLRQEEL